MTHTPMQHALREVREIFSRPIAQMILCAVVLLLAVSGPFGTLDSIPFGPRLAYWAITVPLTFAVGVIASAFIFALLGGAKLPMARTGCGPACHRDHGGPNGQHGQLARVRGAAATDAHGARCLDRCGDCLCISAYLQPANTRSNQYL